MKHMIETRDFRIIRNDNKNKYFNISLENLIYRKVNINGKSINEIVFATFYSPQKNIFSKDVNYVLRSPFSYGTSDVFSLRDVDKYEIFITEGKLNYRYNIIRKKTSFIQKQIQDEKISEEEKKELKKNRIETPPIGDIIYFNPLEINFETKEFIYSKIKNSLVMPMFPNVENEIILAGHLFTSKENAREILAYLNGEKNKISKKEITTEMLEYAKELIETYKKWVEKTFDIVVVNNMLSEFSYYKNNTPYKFFEIKLDEKLFSEEIKKALRNKTLYITKNKSSKKHKIDGFDSYFPHFAPIITKRIEAIAEPVHREGDVSRGSEKVFSTFKRKLYNAQADRVEAAYKGLLKNKRVQIIGEMGTGKTFMMFSTLYLHATKNRYKMKTLILSPDHITDTVWKEEIEQITGDVKIHRVKHVKDLIDFERKGYLDDNEHRAFILAQKDARSSIEYEPAVIFNSRSQTFVCPDCGNELTKLVKSKNEITGQYETKKVPLDIDFFDSRKQRNNKCPHCNTVFWQPYRKLTGNKAPFIYSRELKGFIPRDKKAIKKEINKILKETSVLSEGARKKRLVKRMQAFRALELIIDGHEKENKKRTSMRAPVAEYIFKKMKYRFTGLIIDELHEFQGDSKRTEAAAKLVNSVPIVIAGTGTGMNGYADSRFKTDFMLFPGKYKRAGYDYNSQDRYQVDFGVIEKRYRLKETNGTIKRTALSPKKRPGISPVIFPLFMQDTSVFISMEDLKEGLPKLKYINVPVEMSDSLRAAYNMLMKEVKEKTRYNKKNFRNTVALNYSFLDTPQEQKELKDKLTGEVIIRTPVIPHYDDNKLKAVLKGLHQEINIENRKVIIYTYYSGSGINEYLYDKLVAEGYKVTLLKPTSEFSISVTGESKAIEKENREKFIREEIKKGTEILITNPELVKTGYNLIDFSTIKYIQSGYQVYTNRQADRRIYRLTQTKECRIYYYYYKDTIQEDVVSLMATKIKASVAIEGSMDEMGLEAMVSDRTAEEELAARFYEGIKNHV